MEERNNRTLVEITRYLLQDKELSTKFWVEYVYCANYLFNLAPTRAISHANPFEKWCGKEPNNLRKFMCVSWAHIYDDCRKQFYEKIHTYIMMGYFKESKAYRRFYPIKQQIIISRNMIFDENTSSVKLLNSSSSLLQCDPFGIVVETISIVPFFAISTNQSSFVPESNGNQSTSNETVTYHNKPFKSNENSSTPFLPWWVAK